MQGRVNWKDWNRKQSGFKIGLEFIDNTSVNRFIDTKMQGTLSNLWEKRIPNIHSLQSTLEL